MDAAEAEDLCDQLAELASKGPCKDAPALVQARTILRKITQAPGATAYVRERATDVDRALSGWFDAEDKHHALLKGYSKDIYALIDQMHSALREAPLQQTLGQRRRATLSDRSIASGRQSAAARSLRRCLRGAVVARCHMLEKLPEALGHLLGSQRAGLENILFNTLDLRDGTAKITLTSPAFVDHAPIPPQYTADGAGVSPEIDWNGIPPSATSLALIVEDADSPTPAPLVHAIAVDIDPRRLQLQEGELQETEHGKNTALSLGRNSYLRQAWLPPDPPPGHGIHRYAFQLFALAGGEPFYHAPGRHELIEALRKRAIASGCLIGTYTRDNRIKVSDEEAQAAIAPAGLQAID